MALTVNNALIAAQAQAYAAPKSRGYAPAAPGERGTGTAERQSENNAVRVELSAAAKEAAERKRSQRAEQDQRDADRTADDRYAEQKAQQEARDRAREFAREAPLKSAQQNAGARDIRPGTNLDIRI